MVPIISGANLEDKKIAVGPSAPPIIPIAPACWGVKPIAKAPKKVRKMPICAAAPKSINLGLDIKDEKSVMAPMPKKTSGGYHPFTTPEYKMFNTEPSS